MDPLWNSLVVGGLSADGTPFLGTVGMLGTAYTDQHIATGAWAAWSAWVVWRVAGGSGGGQLLECGAEQGDACSMVWWLLGLAANLLEPCSQLCPLCLLCPSL